jgi:hypothetical protein
MLPASATAIALKVANTQRAVANCPDVTSDVLTLYQLGWGELVFSGQKFGNAGTDAARFVGERATKYPPSGNGPS